MELNASGFESIILEMQLCKKEKWFICSQYKLYVHNTSYIRDDVLDRSFSELMNYLQIESPTILIIGFIKFDTSK